MLQLHISLLWSFLKCYFKSVIKKFIPLLKKERRGEKKTWWRDANTVWHILNLKGHEWSEDPEKRDSSDFDSHIKRHKSQAGGRPELETPLPALPYAKKRKGGREGLRWANRAERKSTKSRATNKTLGPLTWCELKPSSVSLHLRHQIMIPCCSATQQNYPNVNGLGSAAAARKSLGSVSGSVAIWSGGPSLCSSSWQAGRLLGESYTICALRVSYCTWHIQITCPLYANEVEPQQTSSFLCQQQSGHWDCTWN